jgi:transcriptional regulator with XRE-family HTH domain
MEWQNCGMAKLTEEDIILKYAIAERIAELRAATGLTQIEFAKKHDIDRQILNRWESKKNARGITIYTVMRFCGMLGITLAEFFYSTLFEGG